MILKPFKDLPLDGYTKIFNEFRKLEPNAYGQYIFRIKYRYNQVAYVGEWDIINEFAFIDISDEVEWEIDWWEGQEDCELIGYICIDDIPEEVFKLK